MSDADWNPGRCGLESQTMDETLAGAADTAAPRRLWLYLLPIAIFAGIGVLLYAGLYRDPTLVPSPLIGKPVPVFALGPVRGREHGLSSRDLRGEVTLVNVFASWCVACRDEHPCSWPSNTRA